MEPLRVNLGPRSYAIQFAKSGEVIDAFLPVSASALFVVADANTQVHATKLKGTHAVVPAGETSKSLAQLNELFSALAAMPADRLTVVVAVGGGVIGDLAGFAAATYNRGLRLVMVPTTLLAMVDSSVGGKVGINIPAGKNLVGAFHQPVLVWIDPTLLNTLPEREYRSGLAEVVKYGMIADADFLTMLEANVDAILARDPAIVAAIVRRSCEIKARVVEQDEFEITGLRATLNYGHTFAHAFEAVAGYGTLLHGEAVSIGMVCASDLACRLGMIGRDVHDRQSELLKRFQLPVTPSSSWDRASILDAMRRDKKNRAGKLRFILPKRIGEVVFVDDVADETVRKVVS